MSGRTIRVDLSRQTLTLLEGSHDVASYRISTAAAGAGEREGSLQTPRGLHEIREKVGAGEPEGAVFKARRATGELCTPECLRAEPDRDWILTRILWLGGLEPGRNLGGAVDTQARHVYIHGTPHHAALGSPASHGCIRMSNTDVLDLFDRVEPGDRVQIQ
ncbi:MAG: L,D-transpeptidase [Deltaproteobacteria bacterium]|nr:L,D-transpeptidase [Deltaproteobacteria bacterium]MBW2447033.1 L,D-transpeptidase [Deltaproteobacteria bacterium]